MMEHDATALHCECAACDWERAFWREAKAANDARMDAECAKVFWDAKAGSDFKNAQLSEEYCRCLAPKNAQLSEELYEVASRPGLWQYPEFALPRSRWYTRLWWRVKAKLPRVHFGPCDHEHCDGY